LLQTDKPDDLLGDGDLELANLSTGRTLIHVKTPHRGGILLNSNGTRAVFLCRTEQEREFTKTYLKVWDLTPIREIAVPHLDEFTRLEWPMAIDSSGAKLLSRDGEGTRLRLTDLGDGKTNAIDTSPIRPVNKVSFSKGLLAISTEQRTSLWNKVDGEPSHLFSFHSTVELTRNGKWRVYVGTDASVYLAENRDEGRSIKTPIVGRLRKD
jgi:hypothetical protein